MANLIYGPGIASGGFLANNSPAGMQDTLFYFNYLIFTIEQPGIAVGDYRLLNESGLQDYFLGTRFGYSVSGVPTAGVITGLQRYYNGQPVANLSGISVPVVTLETWVANGSYELAGATLFAGDDTIIGTSGNDTLDGYGGNNLLLPGTGFDTLIGGSGIDTVILPDAVKQDYMVGSPQTGATIIGPDISDSLAAIDRIQFVDGTKYFDVGSPAAQVVRMYRAALGRDVDPIGLTSWVTTLKGGASIVQLGASFIASPEFQTRFPGAGQSATAFVTQLYANVLHRAPDGGGLSYWTAALQGGAKTQAMVLAAFSESPENQSNTAGSLASGIWVADEQAASVARLYFSAINRAPDAAGLAYWTNALKAGTQTLQQEANGFVGSAEFQQKYGALSNADFVNLIYTNVLGRHSDTAGFAYWSGVLNTGAQSRATVLTGFSESAEHQNGLASRIEGTGIVLGP